ncbi:MAG: hypothetical protein AAF725_16980 [Acidobacteriota bacterium]
MYRLVLVSALLLLLPAGAVSGRSGEGFVDYSGAEFEFRTDPEAIVLAVHSAVNFGRSSVLLYGDRRVEIQIDDQRFERRVTLEEMREVLELAALS